MQKNIVVYLITEDIIVINKNANFEILYLCLLTRKFREGHFSGPVLR